MSSTSEAYGDPTTPGANRWLFLRCKNSFRIRLYLYCPPVRFVALEEQRFARHRAFYSPLHNIQTLRGVGAQDFLLTTAKGARGVQTWQKIRPTRVVRVSVCECV